MAAANQTCANPFSLSTGRFTTRNDPDPLWRKGRPKHISLFTPPLATTTNTSAPPTEAAVLPATAIEGSPPNRDILLLLLLLLLQLPLSVMTHAPEDERRTRRSCKAHMLSICYRML